MDGEDPGDGQLILRSKDNEARVDKYPVRYVTRETSRRCAKEAKFGDGTRRSSQKKTGQK